ncbi:hypothetical protein DMENIID0001_040120 [Sergentomyia squamirostris]
MNFMLTCTLFYLGITLTLGSIVEHHVEHLEPPVLSRTTHLIRKIHAPAVAEVHHHVEEVPVPVHVPVHVPVAVAVPVAPAAVVAPVEIEEVHPFEAIIHKIKCHFLGKRSLGHTDQAAALLHRKFDYLANLGHH